MEVIFYLNDKYYDKVRKDIKRERERVFGILQENEIRFLESDTNYFLIETKETRDIVQDQLEKRDNCKFKGILSK